MWLISFIFFVEVLTGEVDVLLPEEFVEFGLEDELLGAFFALDEDVVEAFGPVHGEGGVVDFFCSFVQHTSGQQLFFQGFRP